MLERLPDDLAREAVTHSSWTEKRSDSYERLAFLGDYLGRGDSDACARRIRDVADVAVVGNRDLDWQHRVAPETRTWVLGLPTTASVDRLLVAHGDARLTRGLGTSQIGRQFVDQVDPVDRPLVAARIREAQAEVVMGAGLEWRLRRDDGDTIQRRSNLKLVPIHEYS